MGAVCCVAAGPHGARSTTGSQDCYMDPNEPRWRTNSSLSPPLSRRWDCRFQSEALSHRIHDVHTYGSSLSSRSKSSRNELNSDQCPNHHHSVSDGALSYFGSPDTLQAPRWTAPLQKLDLAEFSTPSVGARQESSFSTRFSETRFTTRNDFQSSSQITESSGLASSSKHLILFPPRNFHGRRSFMSKPVYPIVSTNPASEAETSVIAELSYGGRMTPDDDSRSSSMWHDSILSQELKLQKGLNGLQKMDASPDLSTSSRREGFRWSNASSYEFGYERDVTDHIDFESHKCPSNSLRYQKCRLCEKLLWKKSPWSSHRIIRSADMPVAAILACGHVFHADCLEETTPKSQIHEPPCPLCQKILGDDNFASFSEPLQVDLRSLHRNQGENIAAASASSSKTISHHNVGDLRGNQTLPQTGKGRSLIKGSFKKRLPFKGKMGRDLFGAKIFRKAGSSSSSILPEGHSQAGSFKASEHSRCSGS